MSSATFSKSLGTWSLSADGERRTRMKSREAEGAVQLHRSRNSVARRTSFALLVTRSVRDIHTRVTATSQKTCCPITMGNMQGQKQTNGPSGDKMQQGNKDVVQSTIGSFGRYHFWICLLLFSCKFSVAFQQMAIIFLAPKTSFTCPDTRQQTCPCPDPIYDTSVFNRTIVMEWDLICEKRWLKDFTQTLFQLGTLLGSVFFGMASDRFGRKYPLCLAVLIQVVSGTCASFMRDYWLFTFLRFITGIAIGGQMVVSFVMVMEFVGKEYRDVVSALYQTPFNMGHILLAVFGYFFRDYTSFLLGITLPNILLLSYVCLLSETPRWLLAVKKTDKAIHILEKVAKINKRPTDSIRSDIEENQKSLAMHQARKGNILDLVRTPNLRRNTICMSFNWLVCSYCFYGVSQYVGQLSGNVFLNVAASASVTLVGTLLSIPLMKVMGRKTIIIVFNIVCAVCLLSLSFVSSGWLSITLASIGVVASFIVFVLVYLYCSELFPTVVRNAALGVSSMMARVGSMVAPFIVGLNEVAEWMPPIAFGVMPIIAAVLCFFLPETKGCHLMTTIEEGENFGKKSTAPVEAGVKSMETK